jgi:regulator of sigma E protease
MLLNMTLLVIGFGFVIFVHELGHFLAAKWVGIRVEQFAIGFGHALFSFRKGMGLRLGSSGKGYTELEKKAKEDPSIDLSGYGETEYRFNWIPLGGYVKMLGQDDLNPNAKSADARSYNSKSIGARMVVVSAGVIMNIIFGALGFMILFQIGLRNPPAIAGSVQPFSPARAAVTLDGKAAPLEVGDQILEINGRPQYDFTKVRLAIALARGDSELTMLVKRRDGRVESLRTTPRKDSGGGFLYIGFTPPPLLRGPELRSKSDIDLYNSLPEDQRVLRPGERIVEAAGVALAEEDYVRLDGVWQASAGRAVSLKVADVAGGTREVQVRPIILDGEGSLSLLEMQPRTVISGARKGSPVADKVVAGDVVLSVSSGEQNLTHPPLEAFRQFVLAAGKESRAISLTLQRGDKVAEVTDVVPTVRVADGYGLGVDLAIELGQVVVAGAPADKPSPLPAGSRIERVGDVAVKTWAELLDALRTQKPGAVSITAQTPAGEVRQEVAVTESELARLAEFRYAAPFAMAQMQAVRKTDSMLEAAKWGVAETRDFVQQFYIGLQRMFQGTVSPKNMMGPLGMFHAGSFFAEKGLDSVLWFLAMISANLALVNFLPIPIVDGGLFLFLVIEKIQGKPLSARAQSVAQWVGLTVLLSVFVFATYHDILRFLTLR